MPTYTIEDYKRHSEEYIGVCKNCGEERECCEPDADGYECECCGESQVFGCDILLIQDFYTP